MTNEIPERLKALRQAKGWTQEELAGRLGVALRTLQRWEAGTHQPGAMGLKFLQDLEEKAGRRVSEEEFIARVFRELRLALGGGKDQWDDRRLKALAERIYDLVKE